MKKIKMLTGKFAGKIFKIEDYLYLDGFGQLWNSNTSLSEALPGDMVTYEKREQITFEGQAGTLILHPTEMVLEPTCFQVVHSKGLWQEHTHVFSSEEIYSSRVMYRRENKAAYLS